MGLKGWMTKTPLCSCRMHSFSTAISLPYTYRDCLLSCGRSRARHPQVAVLYPAMGPLALSMAWRCSPPPPDQPEVVSILTLLLLWMLLGPGQSKGTWRLGPPVLVRRQFSIKAAELGACWKPSGAA